MKTYDKNFLLFLIVKLVVVYLGVYVFNHTNAWIGIAIMLYMAYNITAYIINYIKYKFR